MKTLTEYFKPKNMDDSLEYFENASESSETSEKLIGNVGEDEWINSGKDTMNEGKENQKIKRKRLIIESDEELQAFDEPKSITPWKMRIRLSSENPAHSTNCMKLRERQPKNYAMEIDEKSLKKRRVTSIFTKTLTPKPAMDPQVVEARRNFLLSGVPESLRKELRRDEPLEETILIHFPTISHVQQRSPDEEKYWNLKPLPELFRSKNEEIIDFIPTKFNYHIKTTPEINPTCSRTPFNPSKDYLNSLKTEYPVYPIRKIYKILKKLAETSSTLMWNDKYRPTPSVGFIGNQRACTILRQFLEMQCQSNSSSDSDDDFEINGSNGGRGTNKTRTTAILSGPNGSGKTSAVYAICEQFGYNLLEINASSRRTGKKLMQELQEATRSHQLRNAICVLLVEDVDVVFEQDDGFISALQQLVQTSKRPIILTTTDRNSSNLQKFWNQSKLIEFNKSIECVMWLRLVALAEGISTTHNDLLRMYQHNNCDIRRTLLELQFWGMIKLKNNPPNLDLCWSNFGQLAQLNCSNTKWDRKKLENLVNSYDILCSIDGGNASFKLKDSLELKENLDNYDSNLELKDEITVELLRLNNCVDNLDTDRWCMQMVECYNTLSDGVGCGGIDRKSIATDYVASVRGMIRAESQRLHLGNKRTRRNNSHLNNFNINLTQNLVDVVSKIFIEDDGIVK